MKKLSMRRKFVAALLSMSMVLESFTIVGAAELSFSDGEVQETEPDAEVVDFNDAEIVEDEGIVTADTENAESIQAVVEDGTDAEADTLDFAAEDETAPQVGDEELAAGTYQIGDNVQATIDVDTQTVIIFGTGDTWNYLADGYDDNDGTNKNPFMGFSIGNITIESGVTSVGDYLFYGCGLEKISIPNGVKYVGKHAFANSSIKSITLPESVTQIGEYCFQWCNNLNSFVHEGTIEAIPNYAFKSCYNLDTFDFVGVKTIGNWAFYNTAITKADFSEQLKTVGYYAFGGCNSLSSVVIPDSVTEIGNFAFADCQSLASVVLPNNELQLSECFSDCISLQTVVIPEKITALNDTFSGCSRLLNVTIEGSNTLVENAFSNCQRLQKISGYDCSYAKRYYDSLTDEQKTKVSFASLGEGTHDWSSEKMEDKSPTCTEKGSKSYLCLICGKTKETEEIAALGHEWNSGVITKEPTQEEEGTKEYTCWRNLSLNSPKVYR